MAAVVKSVCGKDITTPGFASMTCNRPRGHKGFCQRWNEKVPSRTCPKCGMPLVPIAGAQEDGNPELRDMTRRFWIAVALTVPLLAISMATAAWISWRAIGG